MKDLNESKKNKLASRLDNINAGLTAWIIQMVSTKIFNHFAARDWNTAVQTTGLIIGAVIAFAFTWKLLLRLLESHRISLRIKIAITIVTYMITLTAIPYNACLLASKIFGH